MSKQNGSITQTVGAGVLTMLAKCDPETMEVVHSHKTKLHIRGCFGKSLCGRSLTNYKPFNPIFDLRYYEAVICKKCKEKAIDLFSQPL